LRSADRTRPKACPDPDGVTAFRTRELRPGWVPPLPRGRRCSSRSSRLLDRRLPLYRGQSFDPAPATHRQGSASRGINEGSSNSPVRSSPRLWPPGWNGPPLGFPPSFAPRRPGADDARRGEDRPASTGLELRAQHHIGRSSNPCSSLTTCDLASHDEVRASWPPSARYRNARNGALPRIAGGDGFQLCKYPGELPLCGAARPRSASRRGTGVADMSSTNAGGRSARGEPWRRRCCVSFNAITTLALREAIGATPSRRLRKRRP
jgi:hypothetical protein